MPASDGALGEWPLAGKGKKKTGAKQTSSGPELKCWDCDRQHKREKLVQHGGVCHCGTAIIAAKKLWVGHNAFAKAINWYIGLYFKPALPKSLRQVWGGERNYRLG